MNFIVSYADRCQAAQQASFRAGEGRTRPHRWLVETVDRGRLTGDSTDFSTSCVPLLPIVEGSISVTRYGSQGFKKSAPFVLHLRFLCPAVYFCAPRVRDEAARPTHERGPGSRGRSQNNNIEHKRNKHRKVHDSAARKPSRPPTPPHISDTICTSRRSLAFLLPCTFTDVRRSNQAVPADLPPALVCLQYGLHPCHPFIAHHGSCVLHLFSSGVLL